MYVKLCNKNNCNNFFPFPPSLVSRLLFNLKQDEISFSLYRCTSVYFDRRRNSINRNCVSVAPLKVGISEQQILEHFSRCRDCIFPKCTLATGKYDATKSHEQRTTACIHSCVHSRTLSSRHVVARCPALLLAPMRVVSSRVSVNLYSHLTILSGVTVIHVRTTDPLADLPFPRYSPRANGMHTLLQRVECCKRKTSPWWCQIYERKRHKMSSPKEELNRIQSIIRMCNAELKCCGFSHSFNKMMSYFAKKKKEEEE